MMRHTFFVVALICSVTVTACSKGSGEAQQRSETEAPATPPASSTPAATPPQAQAQGEMAGFAPGETEEAMVGTVLSITEVSGSRTMYLELQIGDAVKWVAAPQKDIVKGDRVSVAPGALEMENFSSPSLNRTFERLLLASEVTKIE